MRPAGSGTITISDGIASCPITLRGNALIAGAVDPGGTRTNAAAIEAYIQSLMP